MYFSGLGHLLKQHNPSATVLKTEMLLVVVMKGGQTGHDLCVLPKGGSLLLLREMSPPLFTTRKQYFLAA